MAHRQRSFGFTAAKPRLPWGPLKNPSSGLSTIRESGTPANGPYQERRSLHRAR